MCWRIVSYAMQGLTTFQYEMLAVLNSEGSVYGLKMKRELENRHPKYDGEVNHGRLYPNLDALVDAGLIEKSEKDARTNLYALTDDGRNALIKRVSELGGAEA